MTPTKRLVPFLLLLALAAVPQRAAAGISATVSGNEISILVTLPGGLGADLTLGFDSVTNLSLANLGISAHLINPVSPTFGSRFPSGVLPSLLPVMLRIEPPSGGGLAFEGTAHFELHTHNLSYYTATPLRLFAAPVGGQFKDITASVGAGSYRARGTTGGFSEFVIAVDFRSSNTVIVDKLDRLEDLLENYEGAMPTGVYSDLEARLDAIRTDYLGNSLTAAIAKVDAFIDEVEAQAGTDIPNVWRSARDLHNVAGYLIAGADTLRFSLDRKRSLGF